MRASDAVVAMATIHASASDAVALDERIQRSNKKNYFDILQLKLAQNRSYVWMQNTCHIHDTHHAYLHSFVCRFTSTFANRAKFSFQLMSNYTNVWKHFHILYHHHHHHCQQYFFECARIRDMGDTRLCALVHMCRDAAANEKRLHSHFAWMYGIGEHSQCVCRMQDAGACNAKTKAHCNALTYLMSRGWNWNASILLHRDILCAGKK